jgi:uncharacterized protein (TIGR03067 family)
MGVKLGCAAAAALIVLAIVGAVLFFANQPAAAPPARKGAGTRAPDLGSAAFGVTELEGIWHQTNGDKDWQFEFRRYTLMERTGSLRVEKRRSTFNLRPSALPKQIDWGDGAVFGIYRLDGPDDLTICFKEGTAPADRPQTFAAAGDDVRLYTFKHVGR